MHMTTFEHQMLNLRGLAYAYKVQIIFDMSNEVTLSKWGFYATLKPEQYKDQMIFEEAIKEFLKSIPKGYYPERRENDSCTNPECSDLP